MSRSFEQLSYEMTTFKEALVPHRLKAEDLFCIMLFSASSHWQSYRM